MLAVIRAMSMVLRANTQLHVTTLFEISLSIARVYGPPVATVIRPPGQPVGRLGISEQYVSSISSFLGVEQGAVR